MCGCFEREAAEMRHISLAQVLWEVDGFSPVNHIEAECLEWGRTAEAVEDFEDVGGAAFKAEGAGPGCREERRANKRFDTVCDGANESVNMHEERGGPLHHDFRP